MVLAAIRMDGERWIAERVGGGVEEEHLIGLEDLANECLATPVLAPCRWTQADCDWPLWGAVQSAYEVCVLITKA